MPDPTSSPSAAGLRAGAAKVDITPADLTGLNPIGGGSFSGVHDALHLRTLFLTDGDTRLALIATDLIEVGDMTLVRRRIEQELGIAADHVLITASHTHSAPRLGRVSPGALAHDGGEESSAYSEWVYAQMLGALETARRNLVPVTVGYGTGHVDVNINRDVYENGRWGLGENPDGPSDKTIRVVKLQDSEGRVVAAVLNYAVHSVVTLGSGEVSSDLAGVAASEVERGLGESAVALWTLGSVGDQNPRMQLGFPGAHTPAEVDAAWHAAEAQGRMVAAEAMRVLLAVSATDDSARLRALERVIPCPARRGVEVMDSMRQSEVETVDLRLIVLRIGAVVLAGVSGEVTTPIADRLRRRSPLTATVLVSMANDRIGYLPADEDYSRGTFEANGSPIQEGYAADAIVDGLADMIAITLT